MERKVLLLIIDGVGVAPKGDGNAIALADTKNLIRLWGNYPHTYLEASSEHVGLAPNTNGNSEVGHLTIGAGKINYQNLLKINNSIKKGMFFENQTLKNLLYHAVNHNSKIHLMGCLSDGAVHSHIDHFVATLEFFKRNNFTGEILFHVFTDGRDVPPKSANLYIEKLEEKIKEFNLGRIATVCGRAYAMDRNNALERTKKAYDLIMWGQGRACKNAREAISKAYDNGEIDEYVEPSIIFENDPKESTIKNNDAILFLNFRPDRAIQLTKALKNQLSRDFQSKHIKNLFFCGMVEYEKDFPEKVIFLKEYIALPIGRVISDAGLRQLRIAETEKFPHVTYFLNGGLPIQYAGEDRIKIPSVQVQTYDMHPEMSALEVMSALNRKLDKRQNYNFITVNLANADMVGHTGNIEATVKAIETVDYVVDKLVKTAKLHGWSIIITADHGNAERMIDTENHQKLTEHTQNPVPLIIINENLKKISNKQLPSGTLCDIAPTVLELLNLKKPSTMTGQSLIKYTY